MNKNLKIITCGITGEKEGTHFPPGGCYELARAVGSIA